MKQFILSLLIILANISSVSADGVDVKPSQILQTDIIYSYKANDGDILNSKTKVKFEGKAIGNGISRGRCYFVLSKSPNIDDFSNCYYFLSGQISIYEQGVEKLGVLPHWDAPTLKYFQKFNGIELSNTVYNTKTVGDKIKIPNGRYYQYMILRYVLNPGGKFTVIKEASNQMVDAEDGILYAVKETIPSPDPDPQNKFDLSVESIKVTPTSNYIDGDVKASVTIKNNGNKTANNCCVRFFLSKNNTVNKPYQYLFSTVFKLGSLNAGSSITHEETLYFLSQSAASPGSYYIIADVYSSSAEKEDADNTNNQKATPFTVKSSKSLNIINERSFIRINNITEEDLGNTIYITGSNAKSIKQIPINTTGEMMITNQWSDPILFITIVNKDGTKEDLKMNNTK